MGIRVKKNVNERVRWTCAEDRMNRQRVKVCVWLNGRLLLPGVLTTSYLIWKVGCLSALVQSDGTPVNCESRCREKQRGGCLCISCSALCTYYSELKHGADCLLVARETAYV